MLFSSSLSDCATLQCHKAPLLETNLNISKCGLGTLRNKLQTERAGTTSSVNR